MAMTSQHVGPLGHAEHLPSGTRREFLITAGVLVGGLATGVVRASAQALNCTIPSPPSGSESPAPAYQFPTGQPARQRKSFADLSASELAQLVQAYSAIKALPSNDTRQWCAQADIHANHCTARRYYLLVHDSWLFLPWHRSYVYFYETILGQLINNPSFALPYWDWTLFPTIPEAFFDTSSPLYDPNRGQGKGDSIVNDPEVYQYTRKSFIDSLLQESDFFDFGGAPGNQHTGQPGDLENYPHNNVHSWVGTQQNPFIDMGNLSTAARDLLFFMHHANIDYLWSQWTQIAGHNNPDKQQYPQWYSQWFNFYEGTGKQVSVTIDDTVNGNINVVYAAPKAPPALVAAGRPAAFAALPAIHQPVTMTEEARPHAERLMAEPTRTAGPRVVLVLEGVEVPADVALRLRVFLNKADANAHTSLDDLHYVGTLPFVPSFAAGIEHMDHQHLPRKLTLDVTRKIGAIRKEKPDLTVTLVPVSTDGKALEGKQVKVGSVSLNVRR